jgi:hypothetical protein
MGVMYRNRRVVSSENNNFSNMGRDARGSERCGGGLGALSSQAAPSPSPGVESERSTSLRACLA